MTNFLQLKSSWVKKVQSTIQRKGLKSYLHFDKPFKRLDQKNIDNVTNSSFVIKHGFFPLLKYTQRNRVYTKDKTTKKKHIKIKKRPIAYASHTDSLIYSWYSFQIEVFYEKRLKELGLDSNIIAYRKLDKSNIDFALEVFDFIKEKQNYSSINLDIEGFYDNLDHVLLKEKISEIMGLHRLPEDFYKVYKSVTTYAFVESRDFTRTIKSRIADFQKGTISNGDSVLDKLREKSKIKKYDKAVGIPQGTPISCVLSNLYMLDFDIKANALVEAVGGLYRRYSDDIIILCPTADRERIEKVLYEEIDSPQLKLRIQQSKTEIRDFIVSGEHLKVINEKGEVVKLQYLGVEFNGRDMYLRHKAYAKYERRMTSRIKQQIIRSRKDKKPFTKRKIYERYSPLRNVASYIDYALSASDKLNSSGISKQVKPERIMNKINKKIRFYIKKKRLGKGRYKKTTKK